MSGATTPETPKGDRAAAADDDGSGGSQYPGGSQDPGGPAEGGATAGPGPGEQVPERARRLSLTKSTARPEGGGRAVGGDAPAPARQWPILAVTAVAALGLVLVATDGFRVGTVLLGTALLAGAGLRLVLPSVGMLAVRSRFTDVFTYAVLGTAIVLLALMAQPDPIVEFPFLRDVVRFSVR